MYAVVFFLLLWSLFQLILCEVTTPHFHLLESNEKIHRDKNAQFISKFNYWNENNTNHADISILYITSDDLITIIEDTKNLTYVIDLHLQDIKNYDKIDKNAFEWASETEYVCKIDMNNLIDEERMSCHLHKELRQPVKMVSKAVHSIQSLFNLIRDFEFDPRGVMVYTILFCIKEVSDFTGYKQMFLFNDTISIWYSACKYQHDVTELSPRVIAVIAPNPEWIEETNKPVIFYDEFYDHPEGQEFYGNSMVRVRNWKPMTNTFLQYIYGNSWNRVAILSDDTLESERFETELRSSFNAQGMTYTVRSVGEINGVKCCDFSKALASLKRSDPRIIIANVAEKNAKKLAQQAKRLELTFAHNVLWLARGWSEATAKDAAKSLVEVISVTPLLTPIVNHIASIERVILYYNNLGNNHFRKYYDLYNETQFAQNIEKELDWSDEGMYNITLTKSNGDHKVIATYVNGRKTFSGSNIYVRDRDEQCTLRSNNYDKPCEDMDLIFFLLVVGGFSVTLLAITYYYQIPYTPDTRYNRMPR